MAIDVLKEHIPGIKEHGIVTDATVTLTGTVTLPTGTTLAGGAPTVLTSTQITTVSDSAVYTLGTRAKDASGNEYIFLKGLTAIAVGTWVTFDELGVTALLTSNAIGMVAIATSVVDANTKFGWFQIYGTGSGVIGNEVSGDKVAYISSVTGSVDDLLVTGDAVHGAIIRGASAVTGAAVAVHLNYPFVIDTVL